MKSLYKFVILLVLSLIIVTPFLATSSYALTNSPTTEITKWEMKWEEDNLNGLYQNEALLIQMEKGWSSFSQNDPLPQISDNVSVAWLKFQLPEFNFTRPALLIHKLYSKDVTIYIDDRIVYETKRNYPYNKNEILLTLNSDDSSKTVLMKLNSDIAQIGLQEKMIVGEYQALSKGYMKRDILDFILGSSLIFIALAMLICILFLNEIYLAGWTSLSTVILSVGVMILTYSPYLHKMFSEFGVITYFSFDIASTVIMPAIFIFFEQIFGTGPHRIVSRFRKLQVTIALISIVWLFTSFTSDSIRAIYDVVIPILFGLSVITGNLLLVGILIYFSCKGKKEAIILITGFGIFAGVGISEIALFFIKKVSYDFYYWKWGMFCFITSLIIILVRRILQNYEQVVRYSKQLEIFNNELQRSEKMEIISQLAASVAHEVRNPLQVTRGFLQLLGEKTSNEKDKSFMFLAIDELDRASEIITDFLTFAKPQLEKTTLLNIAEELHQIEGILNPLATMQGGVIKLDVANELFVSGNSSKLKQALINIIKNSIEALGSEGEINIRAYKENSLNEVIIRIKDNGEGMNEADLKRLGEPYYSKKTKGTGLGLMVTYSIIEVMQGDIKFESKKGIGTEVIIRFPSEIKSADYSIME